MSEMVILGFSGGVDSACAAALLRREGYDVRGLYLETGSGEAEAARRCAGAMGLPLEVVDARAELEEHVCRPFAEAYRRGETPSPCVLCNPAVKLRLLCDHADALGAKYIATGHYARAEGGALYMGRPENDQSYMLCRILPEQLSRLLLPLGGMIKTETRALAASLGLPVAQKPDSMELCFVPGGDYAAWLKQRGDAPEPGDIIYNGKAVARHGGIHRFTLGQRRGLGYAAGKRVYVSEIRPDTGEVVLAPELFRGKERLIGYMPQISNFDRTFPISVLEVVLSGLQGHRGFVSRYTKEDRAKALRLLETSGIGETARSPIGEVSGGQMQRALLARAVISDPKLLILDEPANFVDNKFEKELYRTLHELNARMAIVMVSHDIGTITSVVKEIVCVNRQVHRHRSNILTEEQLRNYDCPIQLVSHGHIPHTVLEHHPGDCCRNHE